MSKLRVAVLGCGAIAEAVHIPLLAASEEAELVMLVDSVAERARGLGQQYGVKAISVDYREVVGKADVAIVALPNDLHASVTTELVKHGIHVSGGKADGVERQRVRCDAGCG